MSRPGQPSRWKNTAPNASTDDNDAMIRGCVRQRAGGPAQQRQEAEFTCAKSYSDDGGHGRGHAGRDALGARPASADVWSFSFGPTAYGTFTTGAAAVDPSYFLITDLTFTLLAGADQGEIRSH
jgi:hypothetical protein